MYVIAIVPCLVVCAVQAPPDHERSVKALQAIRNAYEENRARLAPGIIKFRVTTGQVASVQEGLKGNWKERETADGAYVFDGDFMKYEVVYDASKIARGRKRIGEGIYSSSYPSFRFMTDGRISLEDVVGTTDGVKYTYQTQIVPGAQNILKKVLMPLNINLPSPQAYSLGDDIQSYLEGKPDWRLELLNETALLEGTSVSMIVFGRKGSKVAYWIDTQRGTIPLRIRESMDDNTYIRQFDHTDIQKFGNDCWYPRSMTLFNEFAGQPSSYARRVDILTASFGGKLQPENYTITYSHPVNILDTVKSLVYTEVTKLDLGRLPDPRSKDAVKADINPNIPKPDTLPGEALARPVWAYIAVIAGISLLVVAYLRLVRSRRGRSTNANRQ